MTIFDMIVQISYLIRENSVLQFENEGPRFPFDEIFENFGWESNGTGSFPEKIFNLFSVPKKWKFRYFRKFSCSIQKFPVGLFERVRKTASRSLRQKLTT